MDTSVKIARSAMYIILCFSIISMTLYLFRITDQFSKSIYQSIRWMELEAIGFYIILLPLLVTTIGTIVWQIKGLYLIGNIAVVLYFVLSGLLITLSVLLFKF